MGIKLFFFKPSSIQNQEHQDLLTGKKWERKVWY